MDIRNYFKMANMFSQDNAMNPVGIPPEAMSFLGGMGGRGQEQYPGQSAGMTPPYIPWEQGLGPMGRDTFTPNPHINPPIDRPQPGIVTEPPSVHANVQEPAPPISQPLDVQPQYGNEFFQRMQNEPLTPAPTGSPSSNMSRIPEFQPMTRASDRVYDMLDQMPSPRPPGIMRKIGASIVGVGMGPQYAEKALYGPYKTEYEQWQDRFKPTLDVANQERYYNANMRSLYDNAVRAQQADERNRIAQQRADTGERNVESQIASRESMNRLRDWRREHPQGQVVIDRDGYIHIMDRTVGAEYPDTNTGVLSKDVDAITMENLRQRGRREIQATREEGLDYRQERNIENQQDNWMPYQQFDPQTGKPQETVLINRRTGQIKPMPGATGVPRTTPPGAGGAGRAETEANIRTGRINRRNELITKNPDLADLISLDPTTGEAIVEDGGGWFSGPELTPQQVQQYRDYINGASGRTIPGGGGPDATIQAPGKTPGPLNQNQVRIRDPKTGRTGTFNGTAEEAKKLGLEVIK